MAGQQRQKVAIVGCGVAGLAAIKSCLEEGLQPHCFEMNSEIGGLWYTSDSPKLGGGPMIYDSLITNTSKAMMCFSDFPCPASYPPYLPHKLYEKYLHSYAGHFKLYQYITFNTKVLQVQKAEDYDDSGCWIVTTSKMNGNPENEQKVSQKFDGVILCQGFYRNPWTPQVSGLTEKFQGHIHHAMDYRNSQPYKDKTVIVVGCASSAGDIACDLAPVAKQVYLSIRTGAYCVSRLQGGRMPLDFLLIRAGTYVPQSLASKIFLRKTKWLDPVASGLQPKPSVPASQVGVVVNDQLPYKIMTGQVKVVSEIQRLADSGEVHLEDGRVLQQVDDIIFATGYTHDFSVVDPSVVTSDPKNGKLELYKMAFPVSLPHDSLALVGCLRAVGPVPPIIELQARLVARVLAGKHRLPDRTAMKQDIDQMNQMQIKLFGCYKYMFQYLHFSDNIATVLGVRPHWWHLLLSGDLKMARAVMFGPAHPFHYRLTGPHTWQGARDATLNAYKETVFSTQYRTVGQKEEDLMQYQVKVLPVVCICIAAAIFYFFKCCS